MVSCMRRFWIAAMLCAIASGAGAQESAPSPTASVVRVLGIGEAGRQYFGSGVVVARGKVATNCHVTRKAVRIRVHDSGSALMATAQHAAADRDLCILTVPGLRAPVARIGATRRLQTGDSVLAIGFPGGRFSGSRGEVAGLFELHGGYAVQSTARFTHGASGGGLFDDTGALIGLLTFFRTAEGHAPAYFAIPVEWLEFVLALESRDIAPHSDGIPFWALSIEQQPVFLRAAALEIAGKWDAMLEVAYAWTREEPFSANAWQALAKASALDGDFSTADLAFQRARAFATSTP
jgi:serine protease Do